MREKYDVLIIGPISLDQNIDEKGNEYRETGGAIVQAGFAAAHSGNKTALFTKMNPEDVNLKEVFKGSNADIFWKPSLTTCSIRNTYLSADREKRNCYAIQKCDPFLIDEFPDIEASVFHFAGLMYGDFDAELFKAIKEKGKVAVDMQCMLRHVESDYTMRLRDWTEKQKYMSYIDFLKTDAAEAEILTGLSDRHAAAKQLYQWGAKEVMITHNTEVLIYDGKTIYTSPIMSRNISGRTGRGDTCFAGYITERLHEDIPTSLKYASALVSLKMETPGPFRGIREDVESYITKYYSSH